MRRRNSPPPFEIMTGLPPSAGGHGTSEAAREPSMDDRPAHAGWWERAKYPVVLRVPRGYVALGGAFLVSVLVLSYLVGQSRGLKEGIAQTRAEYEQVQNPQRGVVIDQAPSDPALANAGTVTGKEPPLFSQVGRDPRKVGLNYFVLATDDEKGARKLLNFLWGNKVEAAAFENTRGDYKVMALEGFRRSDLDSDDFKEYRRMLERLGAEWGRMPGGIDFLKLGMHPELYKGEEVARMIVRDAQP